MGHLVETMDAVTERRSTPRWRSTRSAITSPPTDIATVRYQAREEVAMRKILEREGAQAFINNFQDLYGMEQLPGLASQNMMADGIGYGGEGDWKVSAMTAIMKKMAEGLEAAPSSWRTTPMIWSPATRSPWAPTCWRSALHRR